MVNIYTLADPTTNEVRYVGKTERKLSVRLGAHLSCNQKERKKNRWVDSLRARGLIPKIELIDRVSHEVGDEEEKFYIAYFKLLGFSLTNVTDGGNGSNGYRPTQETLKKLSLSHFGTNLGHRVNEKSTLAVIESSAKRRKPVVQYDMDWNEINTHESLMAAAKFMKCSKGNIGASISSEKIFGSPRQSHGFYWRYK